MCDYQFERIRSHLLLGGRVVKAKYTGIAVRVSKMLGTGPMRFVWSLQTENEIEYWQADMSCDGAVFQAQSPTIIQQVLRRPVLVFVALRV